MIGLSFLKDHSGCWVENRPRARVEADEEVTAAAPGKRRGWLGPGEWQ